MAVGNEHSIQNINGPDSKRDADAIVVADGDRDQPL